MATTTAAAFNDFKNKLLLTDVQRAAVSDRRDSVAGYLRAAFPGTSTTPVSTTKVIGSAQRAVLIRPLDDIDVLAVFQNKDDVFKTYRYNSQAFLYRVRDGLKAYSSVRVVGARGQAVRFFYADAPHVDVAPVFRWSGGGYALPNGTGGWLTTDPDYHATFMTQRNEALGGNLKPLIRMLKRWNNVHSKYLKSFHLELMAQATFTTLASNSRINCATFFDAGQAHIDVYDPAGHSGNLASGLTATRRANLLSNMESARRRAVLARDAESVGDHAEAIRHWRIIFGDEFQVYG